jgi:hypothetical protein
MTGMFFAWALGEGIIFYRWGKLGAPPTPGVLALSSSLFLGLAVIGEYRPARPVVTAFAFAVDLAILLQVVGKAPTGTTGWPPDMINDPTAILPPGASAGSGSGTAAPAAAGPKTVPSSGPGSAAQPLF